VFIAVSPLLLVGCVAVWLTVFRNHAHSPTAQPKTAAELIVGSWRLIQRPEERNPNHERTVDVIFSYAKDGSFTLQIWDVIRGSQPVKTGTYRLEGNVLELHTPWIDNDSTSVNEISETSSTIESITEEEMVLASVTRRRWTPRQAQILAEAQHVPLEQLLSEVREEHSRTVLLRVKDE
jgi:hypothetical protein